MCACAHTSTPTCNGCPLPSQDGDGDIDVLVSRTGTNWLLLNNGTGFFVIQEYDRAPFSLSTNSLVASLADTDGDGLLEALTGSYYHTSSEAPPMGVEYLSAVACREGVRLGSSSTCVDVPSNAVRSQPFRRLPVPSTPRPMAH